MNIFNEVLQNNKTKEENCNKREREREKDNQSTIYRCKCELTREIYLRNKFVN